MKYLLMMVVVFLQTITTPESARKQIYKSQRVAQKNLNKKSTRWNYEQTMTHAKSLSYSALQKFDSAFRSHGTADPFADSLTFLVVFQIEGYYGGIMWRDSSRIYTWDYTNRFHFAATSVSALPVYQQRLVKRHDTLTDSLYSQISPEGMGGQEHGDYVSLTKWYAPALKKQTVTRLFFVPPKNQHGK